MALVSIFLETISTDIVCLFVLKKYFVYGRIILLFYKVK